MAHFAELNDSNIVTQVLVVANAELLVDGVESESRGIDFLESLYGHRRWKQTSYNGNIRRNYAGIGFTYDAGRDAFVPPQPFLSWTLGDDCRWHPPVDMPADGRPYRWNEGDGGWEEIA